jgi:hypothetical protein
MPGRGKIDYGKPPMTQPDAAVLRPPFTGNIRASVAHGIPTNRKPSALGHWCWRGNAYDAAHDRFII